MKQTLTLVLLLFSATFAEAKKDIYVSQNGLGALNGHDAADAFALSFLNNALNWGTGPLQINPGDTVHLVGTLTSIGTTPPFNTALNLPGSGTLGNPITILFEPGANLTSPCWPSSGAIN